MISNDIGTRLSSVLVIDRAKSGAQLSPSFKNELLKTINDFAVIKNDIKIDLTTTRSGTSILNFCCEIIDFKQTEN